MKFINFRYKGKRTRRNPRARRSKWEKYFGFYPPRNLSLFLKSKEKEYSYNEHKVLSFIKIQLKPPQHKLLSSPTKELVVISNPKKIILLKESKYKPNNGICATASTSHFKILTKGLVAASDVDEARENIKHIYHDFAKGTCEYRFCQNENDS